jgi:hypothetical protein
MPGGSSTIRGIGSCLYRPIATGGSKPRARRSRLGKIQLFQTDIPERFGSRNWPATTGARQVLQALRQFNRFSRR